MRDPGLRGATPRRRRPPPDLGATAKLIGAILLERKGERITRDDDRASLVKLAILSHAREVAQPAAAARSNRPGRTHS